MFHLFYHKIIISEKYSYINKFTYKYNFKTII